jgi:hypothetical protein
MKLPDPVAYLHTDDGPMAYQSLYLPVEVRYDEPCAQCQPLYTADQMREMRRQALEEAEQIALKKRQPYVADAIRALIEPDDA